MEEEKRRNLMQRLRREEEARRIYEEDTFKRLHLTKDEKRQVRVWVTLSL